MPLPHDRLARLADLIDALAQQPSAQRAAWLGGLALAGLGARRRRRAGLGAMAAIAAIAAGTLALPAQADVVWSTGPGANGHGYRLVSVTPGINWDAAETAASALGGHLATIASADENAFVFNLASQHASAWFTDTAGHARGPWLGGFQPAGSAEPAGGWQWVGGDGPLTFTAWAPGQPNNSGGNESRLQFHGTTAAFSSQWNDAGPNAVALGYVVEFTPAVPEPESAMLLTAGLAALAWRRQRVARPARASGR